MFLRRKAASWSDILLRDEIFHAGIRHCRTPLRPQVPADQDAEILMAANMPGAKVFAPRKVVVRKGDTLTVLAKRHGVPEVKLSEWNGIPPKSPLKVGQEILVLGV